MAELTFTANDRAATALTLFGASGYDVLDLGVSPQAPSIEYSGQRGTLGKRPTASVQDNRALSMTVRTTATSKDVMATRLEALFDVLRLMNDHGGTVTWKSSGQTYRQHAIVLAASAGELPWTKTAENHIAADVQVVFTAAPFLEGDPLDIEDSFDADSESDYTFDAGAAGDVTFGSGIVSSDANHTTQKRMIQTDRGYDYGDCEATVEAIVPSTLNGFDVGAICQREDDENYVVARIDDNGTNSRWRLEIVQGGSVVDANTGDLTSRLTAGKRVWIRCRVEGGAAYLEFWDWDNPIWLHMPATREELKIGTYQTAGTLGKAGIRWIPNDATAELRSFEVRPYSYGHTTERGERLWGAIPGDAPAKAEAVIRYDQLGSGIDTRWGLLAWAERPDPYSLVQNGTFGTGVSGWSTAAVSSLTAAATSMTRVTTDAAIGQSCAEIVCTSTADSGVSYALYDTFRPGETYTVEAWVRSTSDTDEVELVIAWPGVTETVVAHTLTSTWTKISATRVYGFTDTQRPVYVAARASGTGAPTFQLDGVRVWAGPTEPAADDQLLESAPRPAWGFYDSLAGGAWGTRGATALGSAEDAEYYQTDASISAAGEVEADTFIVGPHLISEDPHAEGETLVEVWARMLMSSAFTGGVTVVTSLTQGAAPAIYGLEHGSTGKALVMPDGTSEWVLVRLDTLPFPAGARRGPLSAVIRITATIAAGTNLQPYGIDWLALVNPRQRALSPTGTADADHADFRQGVSVSVDYNTRVRVAPDLSAITESTDSRSTSPGLGGAMLELPPGDVDVLWLSSYAIPDSADDNVGDTRAYPDLHLAVTPRWHLLRP